MDSNFKEPLRPVTSYVIPIITISMNSSSKGSPNSSSKGSPNSSSGAASNTFSPAVIAIIVILGAAFLLVTCYTIMAKFGTPWEVFQRRRWRRQVAGATVDDDDNNPAAVTWPLMEAQQGLEEAVIQAIPVFDYRKQLTVAREGAEGGGSDCAVCLSEFEEGERVRMLPKCSHAFHLPCIDMWLRSHSNCPLCRANITSPAPAAPADQPPPHATEISPQPSPTIDDDDAALQDPGHHQLHIIDENTQGDEADALDTPLTRLRPLNREHKTIPLISRQPHDHHATDADQIFERASLQLGSGFRCFSTGRASLSFRCFSTDRASPSFENDGHESERLAGLDAADSSTVNPRMTRSSSLGFCMDNIIHVHTDNYSYHTREGDHRRVIDLNHEKVVLVDTVHNINSRLEESSSSSNAGGSSSTGSEGMRDFKSKSLNLDDSELKSLKADQSIEDPLMGRMVLSLKGPRAVKRSFSGGRLFGFKVQKNSTAVSVGTSTEAASRLPI